MKRGMPLVLLWSFCAVLILAILPVIPAHAGPASTKPIKVGAILMLTGPAAAAGRDLTRGIELAFDQVGWKIDGRKIKLIREDSGGRPDVNLEKAKKLVQADRVDVILGPLESSGQIAVAPYIVRNNVPMLGFDEFSPQMLRYVNKSIFCHAGILTNTTRPLGAYLYDDLGYRTAIIIRKDDAGGQEFMQGFRDVFTARGGKIIDTIKTPIGTTDYSSYFAAITTKKADIVVFNNYPGSVPAFLKQYKEYGLKMPLAAAPCYYEPEEILKAAGDFGLGMLGITKYVPDIDTPTNKKFVAAWIKKYGDPPGAIENVNGYIAATMFIHAVKYTRGDTSHEKIIKALSRIKVETPAGLISYPPERIGAGIRHSWICKSTKKGNRYYWKVVKKE